MCRDVVRPEPLLAIGAPELFGHLLEGRAELCFARGDGFRWACSVQTRADVSCQHLGVVPLPALADLRFVREQLPSFVLDALVRLGGTSSDVAHHLEKPPMVIDLCSVCSDSHEVVERLPAVRCQDPSLLLAKPRQLLVYACHQKVAVPQ